MDLRSLLLTFLCIGVLTSAMAQKRIGINTDPERAIHTLGAGHQYTRIKSTSFGPAETGIELNRGIGDMLSTDWRFQNDGGTFKIQYSLSDFSDDVLDAMWIQSDGDVGIGVTSPVAPLHIGSGTSIAGGGAYLMLGSTSNSSSYLAMDYREIAAKSGGSPNALYLQHLGGNTNIGIAGGNAFMAQDNGSVVSIGSVVGSTKFQIEDDGYQLYLRNDASGVNDWYIGATDASWFVGDDQLIFSPTSSSNDAVLRLMDVDDNDGTNAPVMIHTTNAQTLLLDGNEIDTRGASMYINYNSENDTYFNSNGGLVGIGTTNPQATLHVKSPELTVHSLGLERGSTRWDLRPTSNLGSLAFELNDTYMAQVQGSNGVWDELSDARAKEDISELVSIIDNLMDVNVYEYSFKDDPDEAKHIGVLAQELNSLFPEFVYEAEGQYGVAYAQLAIVALKALQEQQSAIDALQKRIEALKARATDKVIQQSNKNN